MPKTTDRRIDKARLLLERVERGPAYFVNAFASQDDTIEAEAKRVYKMWSESWILPLIKELIPELKNRKIT